MWAVHSVARKLARLEKVDRVGEEGCDENRAGFYIHLPVVEKKLSCVRTDFFAVQDLNSS